MTRERIEDLGRIASMTRTLLREDSPMDKCTSKHSLDEFIKFCAVEENAEYLHDWFRSHRDLLEEIDSISWGTDQMNWTVSGHHEYE